MTYRAKANFFGLDDIINAIWEAIKWSAEKLAIIASAVWQAVKAAAAYTWDGLKWLGHGLGDALQWLKEKAIDFANWWKEEAAPWISKVFGKIQDWFKAHFGWLFTWVHRIQSILGWVYKNVLRPLLTFLDITRAVLRLLAALGVKWAATLEKALANLENKLLTAFYSIIKYVNTIADIINLLFNPWGAFHRNLALWSLWSYVGDIRALIAMAGIDHDPWPEAVRLALGPDPSDVRQKGNEATHDLDNPPTWAEEGRLEAERLLA